MIARKGCLITGDLAGDLSAEGLSGVWMTWTLRKRLSPAESEVLLKVLVKRSSEDENPSV